MNGISEGADLPRFHLIVESHDGPWSDVVDAWHRATGQSSLCLTTDTNEADARLAVFGSEYEAEEIQVCFRADGASLLSFNLPLALLNVETGEVVVYGLRREDGTRGRLFASKPARRSLPPPEEAASGTVATGEGGTE